MVKFCTAELQGKYLQIHSDGDQKYIINYSLEERCNRPQAKQQKYIINYSLEERCNRPQAKQLANSINGANQLRLLYKNRFTK